ncbi:MAG: hypothetical protein IH865_09435 [Chloroflexi bacterium]|nr:hypothetical protein [Chloroflexota bacterium]
MAPSLGGLASFSTPKTAKVTLSETTTAGIHPKVVSERLGHSTIAITLDTYSNAIPAMREAAAEQVSRVGVRLGACLHCVCNRGESRQPATERECL